MAFVSESERDLSYLPKSMTGNIGPGDYHNEGAAHKETMDAVYPKKKIPFNSQL